MSKKNNKSIQARYHQLSLQREKEAAAKKQQKAEKKAQKEAAQKLASPNKVITKVKRKGIRIRKGLTIKGIKIKDAASKKRARELLAQDLEERTMAVDEPERKKPRVIKKAKKSVPVASEGATPME